MLKLIVNTAIFLFIGLIIAGRDLTPDEQLALAAQAATPEDAQVATDDVVQVAMAETDTAPILNAAVIRANQSDPLVEPQKAVITRVTARATVGPKLRPSPEHRILEAAAEPLALDGGTLWRVTANGLNVRSGPGTSNGRVDHLSRGEEVLKVAEQGNWVKIRIEGDGVEGWVSSRFLSPAN